MGYVCILRCFRRITMRASVMHIFSFRFFIDRMGPAAVYVMSAMEHHVKATTANSATLPGTRGQGAPLAGQEIEAIRPMRQHHAMWLRLMDSGCWWWWGHKVSPGAGRGRGGGMPAVHPRVRRSGNPGSGGNGKRGGGRRPSSWGAGRGTAAVPSHALLHGSSTERGVGFGSGFFLLSFLWSFLGALFAFLGIGLGKRAKGELAMRGPSDGDCGRDSFAHLPI